MKTMVFVKTGGYPTFALLCYSNPHIFLRLLVDKMLVDHCLIMTFETYTVFQTFDISVVVLLTLQQRKQTTAEKMSYVLVIFRQQILKPKLVF